ncbi:hypothetical protein NDU88_001972 [Pleurodeles waltl]|uniref:Uncharacterized protein n=1 Tax=Pleurodeles waltl TaxID=8319 RepID=A0AAV7U8C2_PLEWA|nr:hypothetical protein NDU88_001972 [Pleurodeles waltl]
MFESPMGTQRNLFDVSTKECAYITQGSFLTGKAGSEQEDGVQEKERREEGHEEERRQEEAGHQEEERREETESGDPGQPNRHKAEAEQESRGAAVRNRESEKASHIPGRTWLFQVRDCLRCQLSELVGKVGRYRGGGLRNWERRAQRGEHGKDPISHCRKGEGTF